MAVVFGRSKLSEAPVVGGIWDIGDSGGAGRRWVSGHRSYPRRRMAVVFGSSVIAEAPDGGGIWDIGDSGGAGRRWYLGHR